MTHLDPFESLVGAQHAAPHLGTTSKPRSSLAFGVSLFVFVLSAPCVLGDCKCHRPASGETTREGANLFVVQNEEKPYRDLNGIVEMGSTGALDGVLVEIFDQPGYLLDSSTKAPNQKRLAACVTAADGKFCFRHLPAGKYELRASLNSGVKNAVPMPPSPEHDFVLTREAGGSCPECHYVLPRLVECAPAYFENGHVVRQHCGKPVDLWQAVMSKLTPFMPASWALTWLGAAQTSIVMPMKTGEYYEVQLTKHGAPPDAKILSVSYAPQGGKDGPVIPLEWHGHAKARRFVGTVLRLIAIPLGEGPDPRVGQVAINVVWIRGEESDAWPYLVTAFEAAAEREYAPAMVFAQSAVEISMMPLIEKRFRKHASAGQVKRFMTDALKYSYAVNVVLPYLCAELRVAQMPETIRGALNKLRKKRNAIIHEGTKAAGASAEDAMEGLCAAAFGFEYVRHVGPILSEGN